MLLVDCLIVFCFAGQKSGMSFITVIQRFGPLAVQIISKSQTSQLPELCLNELQHVVPQYFRKGRGLEIKLMMVLSKLSLF